MSTSEASFPIVLDLDGVVLDVSERYFRLHCDLLGLQGRHPLDKDAYWRLKRDAQPLGRLLTSAGEEPADEEAYRGQWMERIEADEYLRYDAVITGAAERLAALGRRHLLVLVTLRQRRDRLTAQLDRLGLRSLFAEVLSAPQGGEAAWETKRRLIDGSGLVHGDGLLVGDTEADIRAGRALGLKTVAVLSGIRSRERLAAEKPDFILESVNALPGVVASLSHNRDSGDR